MVTTVMIRLAINDMKKSLNILEWPTSWPRAFPNVRHVSNHKPPWAIRSTADDEIIRLIQAYNICSPIIVWSPIIILISFAQGSMHGVGQN